jgi:hypothetical protein
MIIKYNLGNGSNVKYFHASYSRGEINTTEGIINRREIQPQPTNMFNPHLHLSALSVLIAIVR